MSLDAYRRLAAGLCGQGDRRLAPIPPQTPADVASVAVLVPGPNDHAKALPWYQEAASLVAAARPLGVANLVVHGSYGDFTATPYSDLDVTLLLDDALVQDAARLVELATWIRGRWYPFMLAQDPLQHHGPFFLWPALVAAYPEAALPIAAYQRAWALQAETISFRPVPAATEGATRRTCRALADPSRTFFKHGYTMYAMKRYLSNLMLLPAFYWLDTGHPVHKADSFEPFYERFAAAADPMRRASELRQAWPASPAWLASAAARSHGLPAGRKLVGAANLAYRDAAVARVVARDIVPAVPALVRDVEAALAGTHA